jgi:hypothetical protein
MMRDTVFWPESLRISIDLRADGHLVLNRASGVTADLNGLNAVSTIPLAGINQWNVIQISWLSDYNTGAHDPTYAPNMELSINGAYAGRWEDDRLCNLDPYMVRSGEDGRYRDSSDYIRLGGNWLNPGDQHNLDLDFADFYAAMDYYWSTDFAGYGHEKKFFTNHRVVPIMPTTTVSTSPNIAATGVNSAAPGQIAEAIGTAHDTPRSDREKSTVYAIVIPANEDATLNWQVLPEGELYGVQQTGVVRAWTPGAAIRNDTAALSFWAWKPPFPWRKQLSGTKENEFWFGSWLNYDWPMQYTMVLGNDVWISENSDETVLLTRDSFNATDRGITAVSNNLSGPGGVVFHGNGQMSSIVLECLIDAPLSSPFMFVQIVG